MTHVQDHGLGLSAPVLSRSGVDGSLVDVADRGRIAFPWRRAAKYAAGLALLAIGALTTYQNVLVRTSREAVLNGRTVVIRAPMDGMVATTLTAPGAAVQRGTALHLRGVQSDDLYERAQRAKEIAQHETIAARKRLEALQVELQAARTGTYLGDSYNDVPSSFQRARELTIRRDETRATLDQLTRKTETLTEQLAAEQKRLIAHTVAALTAPIAGSLWTVQAASGEYVRKGQDLFTVLDCSTVMVTASVSERDYNGFRVGPPVRFRVARTRRE